MLKGLLGADDDDGDDVRGGYSGIFEPPAGQVRGGSGYGAIQCRYFLRGYVPHRPETETRGSGTVSFLFLIIYRQIKKI